METTRKEEGCVSYVLLDNPYDPGGCMFVEEWTDLASLQKHAAAPHIAEWRKQSRELLSGKKRAHDLSGRGSQTIRMCKRCN